MEISYEILWFDDQPDSIREDRDGVEDFLKEFGIEPKISIITTPVDQSIPDLVKDPELDILLVDYRMDDMDGAQLVHQIRTTDHVYLPVIFYSSLGIEDILKAVYDTQLDGVYITDRNYLVQKFKDVALSLLNKEHTPKRTRGLLMEEVSEIDAKFKDIYDHIWRKLPENHKQNLTNYLKNIIEERAKGAEKRLKQFPTHPRDFSHHMSDKFLSPSYDTHTRWRVVCKMLEYLGYDSGNREILKDFKPLLLDPRNIYAHRTKQELREKHSEKQCVRIRREIRRQLDNVNHIIADTISDFQ